jgi:hypothetical protein
VALDRIASVDAGVDVHADHLALADQFDIDSMNSTEPPRATPVSTIGRASSPR